MDVRAVCTCSVAWPQDGTSMLQQQQLIELQCAVSGSYTYGKSAVLCACDAPALWQGPKTGGYDDALCAGSYCTALHCTVVHYAAQRNKLGQNTRVCAIRSDLYPTESGSTGFGSGARALNSI